MRDRYRSRQPQQPAAGPRRVDVGGVKPPVQDDVPSWSQLPGAGVKHPAQPAPVAMPRPQPTPVVQPPQRPVTPVAPSPAPLPLTARPAKKKPRSKRRLLLKASMFLILAVLVTAGAGVAGYFGVFETKDPLPVALRAQVRYGIFAPGNSSYAFDSDQVTYDSQKGVTSIPVVLPTGNKLGLTEQATPRNFLTDPKAYDTMLDSLQSYDSFESPNGKVTLTQPPQVTGEQVAVMNAKGTLMFAHYTGELSKSDWQKFFNQLKLSH